MTSGRASHTVCVAAMAAVMCPGLFAQVAPEQTIAFEVEDTTIDYGVAFNLITIRTWPATLPPTPFPTAMLKPLHVELQDINYTESSTTRTETRMFKARAFDVGTVQLGEGLSIGASQGSSTPLLTLNVRSSLEVRSSGDTGDTQNSDVELELTLLPVGPLRSMAIGAWIALGMGALVAASIGLFGLFWRARRLRATTALPPVTLAELHATREQLDTASQADFGAATSRCGSLVRRFLQQQHDIAAIDATTEELLVRFAGAMSSTEHTALRGWLEATDTALYAGHSDRARLLSTMDAWLRSLTATAKADEPMQSNSGTR